MDCLIPLAGAGAFGGLLQTFRSVAELDSINKEAKKLKFDLLFVDTLHKITRSDREYAQFEQTYIDEYSAHYRSQTVIGLTVTAISLIALTVLKCLPKRESESTTISSETSSSTSSSNGSMPLIIEPIQEDKGYDADSEKQLKCENGQHPAPPNKNRENKTRGGRPLNNKLLGAQRAQTERQHIAAIDAVMQFERRHPQYE